MPGNSMEDNDYGKPLSTQSLSVSNYQGLKNYVKQRRIHAGNPQKRLNDDLYGKHTRAQGRVYNTKKMYELEKNAAKKEALLNNLEEASAEMNSLANALNADSNADYPFLEEYEAMVNRGEVETSHPNLLKEAIESQKKISKMRAGRSNGTKRGVMEYLAYPSPYGGGGGGSQRKSRKSKGRKSRKSKTRRH
jgi:hypothetical protein